MFHADVLSRVAAVPPSVERDAFIEFVSNGDSTLRREGGPEHVTASCFVLSPTLEHALLCFHRKGNFWVQFGGHIEPQDATVADTALREAREESGIGGLALLTDTIVDLDRHELHGSFACAAHWDIGFVAMADLDATIAVSDESEDVRWFPVDALPASSVHALDIRLDRARQTAASVAR